MKKLFAKATALILFVLLFLTSCSSIKRIEPFVWGFSNSDIDKYEKNRSKIEYASEFMPSLDDLDGYCDISYSHQKTTMVFFESNSITLFVEYPTELYEEKKAETISSYEFLQETVTSGEVYCTPPAEFEYKGYSFKTAVKPYVTQYTQYGCKSFAFVGVNDEKCRLAYCYFYDFDLDIFASTAKSEEQAVSDFINDFFNWNDLP